MAKPYPPEFRRDVVAVARKGEAPLNQIAKDFAAEEPDGPFLAPPEVSVKDSPDQCQRW